MFVFTHKQFEILLSLHVCWNEKGHLNAFLKTKFKCAYVRWTLEWATVFTRLHGKL